MTGGRLAALQSRREVPQVLLVGLFLLGLVGVGLTAGALGPLLLAGLVALAGVAVCVQRLELGLCLLVGLAYTYAFDVSEKDHGIQSLRLPLVVLLLWPVRSHAGRGSLHRRRRSHGPCWPPAPTPRSSWPRRCGRATRPPPSWP